MYDVVISSKSAEEHRGFRKNTKFWVQNIIGYIIDKNGRRKYPERAEAMKNMLSPGNVS